MNKYLYYIKASFICQIKEYISLFFGLIFPILLTSIFVVAFGNDYNVSYSDLIKQYFFVGVAMSIASSMLISLPLSISIDINGGYLKQLKLFNVHIIAFKVIDIIVQCIISIIELLIFLLFCHFVFKLPFADISNLLLFFVYLSMGMFSLALVGTGLALLLNNPLSYIGVSIILLNIVLAFSGCFGFDPLQLNISIFNLAKYLPTYYIVNDFNNIYFNGSYNPLNYLISCAIFIIIGLVLLALNIFKRNR